jgi:hypothetical protein
LVFKEFILNNFYTINDVLEKLFNSRLSNYFMLKDYLFLKSKYFKFDIPTPPVQALAVALFSFLMMIAGNIGGDANFPWLASGACTLLFLVFNNAIGIFAENQFKYIQLSLYSFIVLITLLAFSAYLLSGESIFDNGGVNKTIFIILVMANFSLLGLCYMIRNIADFLQNRDEKMHKSGKI